MCARNDNQVDFQVLWRVSMAKVKGRVVQNPGWGCGCRVPAWGQLLKFLRRSRCRARTTSQMFWKCRSIWGTTGCGRWRWTPPWSAARRASFFNRQLDQRACGRRRHWRVPLMSWGARGRQKGPVDAKQYYPIHRLAPPFSEQTTRVEAFETV